MGPLGDMQIWISIFTGLLILLLTTIGGLVLGRLVFMSKQIGENHKEFATAIEALWDDIREDRRKCADLHMEIGKSIGALQERCNAISQAIDNLKKDFWDKADRITHFGQDAKNGLDRRIDEVERKITAIYLRQKES